MNLPGLTFLETTLEMPLLHLPVRTCIVELENARVMLSPGSKLTQAQLRDAGELTDVVAPALLHAGGMAAAAAAHPKARLWGPAGIKEKLPGLPWHGILGVDEWPWERELTHLPLGGIPGLNESVFVHPRSGALLVTDLVFNIEEPKGWGAWLILTLFGTYRKLGVSRFFIKAVKDRAAFQISLTRLAALDFDHLVPSHGNVVIDGAKSKLDAALRERGYEL